MSNREFKLDLVKVNFVIFGAVISAIALEFSYSEILVALGLAILGSTAFMQYLSLLPEFSITWPTDDAEVIEKREEKLDSWYLFFGSTSYIFLSFGFIVPHAFPGSFLGATLPFVFVLLIFLLRLILLSSHPTKELDGLDKSLTVLFSVLILSLTVAVLDFT